MSTTAILTYASRIQFQAYDAQGVNLVGGTYILQATKISPKKTTPKISITNTESPARRLEYAPGNAAGDWSIEGICDQPLNFDQLFSNIMDNALFAQVTYYVAKAGLVANPLIYQAKTLFTEVALNAEISDEGAVLKFTATGAILGTFAKVGASTDTVYVTGI